MAAEVLERLHSLEDQQLEILNMHYAAMKAMDSTRSGGWGSFRVEGLTEEQSQNLPNYIGQYEGKRLPILFFDEVGNLKTGGGRLVDERHTKFKPVSFHADTDSGYTSTLFRWNRELWDPEAQQAQEGLALEQQRKERRNKFAMRTFVGALALAEITGFSMIMKGFSDYNKNATAEEIRQAEELTNNGMYILTGVMGATGVVSLVVLGKTLKESAPNQRD